MNENAAVTDAERRILREVLEVMESDTPPPTAHHFRVNHSSEDRVLMRRLTGTYMLESAGTYHLTLAGLQAADADAARQRIKDFNTLIPLLRDAYAERGPGASVPAKDIMATAQQRGLVLKQRDAAKALLYVLPHAGIAGSMSFSNDPYALSSFTFASDDSVLDLQALPEHLPPAKPSADPPLAPPSDQWIRGPSIGKGGGGEVFFCCKKDLLTEFTDYHGPYVQADPYRAIGLLARLYRSFSADDGALAAMKVAHEPSERVSREIEAMRRCIHPNLTQLLGWDDASPPRWFVMPFYPYGDLEHNHSEYCGRPLEVLRKVRPLVDAVAALHRETFIHRDIKAHNVFIGRNREWILGDLGIVFTPEGDRLTTAGETLFSRDWCPDWMAGKRFDDFGPQEDVYMLAKLVHFAISGDKGVRASQIDEDAFDWRRRSPRAPGAKQVHAFLLDHVVTKRAKIASPNAETFGQAIDALIRNIEVPPVKRQVFGFLSGHSTTHLDNARLSRHWLSGIPVTFADSDTRMYIRLRLIADASTRFVLRVAVSSDDGASTYNLPIDVSQSSEPGQWSQAAMLELPEPATTHQYLHLAADLGNILISGIQVLVE